MNENINIIEEKHVILGYFDENQEYKLFNRCILIGKAMIYRTKNSNVQPDIYSYHCDLKEYILIEKSIASDLNNLQRLEDEWRDLLDI
jgi:hypothetical protein